VKSALPWSAALLTGQRAGRPAAPSRSARIDVTTHREEPVVAKEARVKEEIVVRKEADQRTETVRDTVRQSEVKVVDNQADKPAVPSGPTRKP